MERRVPNEPLPELLERALVALRRVEPGGQLEERLRRAIERARDEHGKRTPLVIAILVAATMELVPILAAA